MNSSSIDVKEYKIIDTLSKRSDITQRDIAGEIGISLGLTNMLINRLVKKGFLKAKKLNPTKVRYIITPKGLNEKATKSLRFMKKSLSFMISLKEYIEKELAEHYSDDTECLLINGAGELADITELILKSININKEIRRMDIAGFVPDMVKAVVFNTRPHSEITGACLKVIDIWEESERLYGSSYELH